MKKVKFLSRLNIGLNILVVLIYALGCIIVSQNPSTDVSFYLKMLGSIIIISFVSTIFAFIIMYKTYYCYLPRPSDFNLFIPALMSIIGNAFMVLLFAGYLWEDIFIRNSFVVAEDFYMLINGMLFSIMSLILAIYFNISFKEMLKIKNQEPL